MRPSPRPHCESQTGLLAPQACPSDTRSHCSYMYHEHYLLKGIENTTLLAPDDDCWVRPITFNHRRHIINLPGCVVSSFVLHQPLPKHDSTTQQAYPDDDAQAVHQMVVDGTIRVVTRSKTVATHGSQGLNSNVSIRSVQVRAKMVGAYRYRLMRGDTATPTPAKSS